MSTTSDKSLWSFLVLTCVISWPLWIASGVLSRGDLMLYDFRWLVGQVGVFGPSLSALIVSGNIGKELHQNSLRILPVLFLPLIVLGTLIAVASPNKVIEFPVLPSVLVVLVAAAIILFFSPFNRHLLNPATGEVQEKPGAKWIFLSIVLIPGLFLLGWLLVNFQETGWQISAFKGNFGSFGWIVLVCFAHNFLLGGSLGEELGWRGFLLPELLKRTGPLIASLILGVVWALWHLPADLSAGFFLRGPGAVLVRIIWTLPIAILFTWFYLKTNGNLLVALFLHTSLNILSDLGFSRYEYSLLFFFILTAVLAFVVSVSSPVFRKLF